jgi:hypothetical protein
MRVAAVLTADQPGRPGMPACYPAAHDHGRLAARNCRAAVAGLIRPGKDAGIRGALPQPPVTGIKRFLRCGDGMQTASGMGKTSVVRTVSAVHQAPRAGKFRVPPGSGAAPQRL